MITAAGAATAFPFVSSFHRPRLRPCPRRAAAVLPARAAGSSSSSSSWEEREEARWLREEQRWQREEQRWLREESRWRAEREALLAEVAALRLRLRALEGTHPDLAAGAVVDAVASPAPPAAVPAPQPRPALVEEVEVEVRKEVVVVEEKKAAPKAEAGSGAGAGKSRRTLRAGAEGEDVRAMQVCVVAGLSFWLGFVLHCMTCVGSVGRWVRGAELKHPRPSLYEFAARFSCTICSACNQINNSELLDTPTCHTLNC